MQEGVSHRFVSRIFQDSKGFVWIGTLHGLNRFDGYGFTHYGRVYNNFAFDDIGGIQEDKKGNIWVGSRETPTQVAIINASGIVRTFQKGTVPNVTHSFVSDSIMQVETWLNRYHIICNDKFQIFPILQTDSLTKFVGITERKTLLLLKNNKTIVETTVKGDVIRKNCFPGDIDFCFRYQPGWGFCCKQKGNEKVFYVDTALQIAEIAGLPPMTKNTVAAFDDIYYTGIDDVFYRQGKIWSLSKGLIRDLTKDGFIIPRYHAQRVLTKGNQLWIGTEYGFYIVTIFKNKFKALSGNSLDTTTFRAFRGLLFHNKNLYVVNEDSGAFVYNNNNLHERKRLISISLNAFSAIGSASNGNIFIGRRNCLYEWDGNTIHTHIIPQKFNRTPFCWAMYEVYPGKFLIGLETGLVWFDIASHQFIQFNQYNTYNDIKESLILEIMPDGNDHFFLCTNKGLYEYNTANGITACYAKNKKGKNYLPANEFQHVYKDKSGTYWIATTEGLIQWNKETYAYKQFAKKDGLSNNNIYAVYEDAFNRLWLSSDYGIMQFDKKTEKVITYLQEDGISNNEFNRISHCMDDEGNIYFGSLTGITFFNPADFPTVAKAQNDGAPLAITSFMHFDGTQNTLVDETSELLKTNTVNMHNNDRYFDIEVALLNYNKVIYNTYYWRVVGVDKDWNQQKDRNIRLSKLPYGNFVLEIKAQEANGNWSKNILQIQLNIIKPFYLRTWFLLVMAALLVGLVVSIFKRRTYLLRKENIRLDRIVTEKTNDLSISLEEKDILLKEIHHRVKNNLQVISSLLRLQSRTVKEQAAKDALTESQNRVMSIALIHQKLYQNAAVDKVDFYDFSSDLFLHLKHVFEESIQSVSFINNSQNIFLPIDVAVPLGLIVNELFTNSFKYAFTDNAEPQIEINCKQNGHSFYFNYRDNGPGLPVTINPSKTKSMGLRLISRLSVQINGKANFIHSKGLQCEIVFSAVIDKEKIMVK